MSRKDRRRKLAQTLEQQLEAKGPRPVLGQTAEPWMEGDVAAAQIQWDRETADLREKIRRRDAKRLRDPGRDVSGNFDVSPYMAREHAVEVAPKSLGKELPTDGSFPRRVTTQRMIDRYKARSQLTLSQWKAANMLWETWNALGLEHRMAAGYDPVMVQTSPSKDGLIAKKVDAATQWNDALTVIPYRSRGVVRAVVVEDLSAGDWALRRGIRRDDSGRVGMGRLRAGLQALADYLKC